MTVKVRLQSGFTLIELLMVVAIIGILMAVAIPGLLGARTSSNESAAIGSMRAIISAEVAYAAGCGNNGFADALPTLGVAPPGSTEGYLSPDLAVAAPQKSGYTFALAAGLGAASNVSDCNGTATQSAFYASAVPGTFGVSGNRTFAANQVGTIWQGTTNVAPAEPFGPPSTPIQ